MGAACHESANAMRVGVCVFGRVGVLARGCVGVWSCGAYSRGCVGAWLRGPFGARACVLDVRCRR
eukprot:6197582-Pleurochrysis_carterae.AAC.1